MRELSRSPHHHHILDRHHRGVLVDDARLPAAVHLTGPAAIDVLAPVVVETGAELVACEPSGVQYRPSSDLVVRYRCTVRRAGVTSTDTLLAATTTTGPLPGTVPVEAVAPDGSELRVGVWRWPFDPALPALAEMVTPHLAGARLGALVGDRPELEVVAYRPTERAVVRARGPERDVYVKVLPPRSSSSVAARHERLVAGGVPAPRVLAGGDGWIALESLAGTTLRDRLKGGMRPLPPAGRYGELLETLAEVDLGDAPPVRSRLDDAPLHAAMLAAVSPAARGRLSEITDRLATGDATRRLTGTVHGDLHEGQLVVDDSRVAGLIDVDDVGPGDRLDDVGTLIAHLRFRAMTSGDPWIDEYAEEVRAVVTVGHDLAAVHRHVAAVLVGLATGPFRIQQPGWDTTTSHVLDLVDRHLDAAMGRVGT